MNSRVTGDKKKSGLIRKYGLNMSRQAFREKAEEIGFQKVSSMETAGDLRAGDGLTVVSNCSSGRGMMLASYFAMGSEEATVFPARCLE